MSEIVIGQVTKWFGDFKALDQVSFKADRGDVVALLGPSGSGKSTLLRCLNQLAVPDAGHIEVGEIVLDFPIDVRTKVYRTKVKQLRTMTGMVFQQFNLWQHRTILENMIEAPIKVLKKKPTDVQKQAFQLLEKVGILDKHQAYPVQLSGGQQQRVAIARALMMQPEAMLFDEPTSALDPEMSREVVSIIQALSREGMTMVIATHEVALAKEVASKVIFLEKGLIIECGEAAACFTSPQTDRLRQFLAAEH